MSRARAARPVARRWIRKGAGALALAALIGISPNGASAVAVASPANLESSSSLVYDCFGELPGTPCEDFDPCTGPATCDIFWACVGPPLANGTPCDDGEACTRNDRCDENGWCEGRPVAAGSACDDLDTCTRNDRCDGEGICAGDIAAGSACDDGDPCSSGDVCDEEGYCAGELPELDESCDDGNQCTIGDRYVCDDDFFCVCPVCAGDALSCDDDDACTADSCNPQSGCGYAPIPCDDGDACTREMACDQNEGCLREPLDCDDDNACTVESCHPEQGCIRQPLSCDDGNPATSDSCDPGFGCRAKLRPGLLAAVSGLLLDDDPAAACGELLEMRLSLSRLRPPSGDDRLQLRGKAVLARALTPAQSPDLAGLRLSIGLQGAPIVEIDLPASGDPRAGVPGWRVNRRGTRWTYKDRSPNPPAGIAAATLELESSAGADVLTFSIKGRRGGYPATVGHSVDVALSLGVEATSPAACWRTTFDRAMTGCVADPSGDRILCR